MVSPKLLSETWLRNSNYGRQKIQLTLVYNHVEYAQTFLSESKQAAERAG